MNSLWRITLRTNPEQKERLRALQQVFAQACNALAPVVRDNRCWNRVALHHMTYRSLRAQFPSLGSQMVCNAIYAVCRTSRLVYQHPSSPFQIGRLGGKPLPLLRFGDDCPVYFDRHTLSLKQGVLSLYTLDGRLRFEMTLHPEVEAAFHNGKFREIVLKRQSDGEFELSFWLGNPEEQDGESAFAPNEQLPQYLKVEEPAA